MRVMRAMLAGVVMLMLMLMLVGRRNRRGRRRVMQRGRGRKHLRMVVGLCGKHVRRLARIDTFVFFLVLHASVLEPNFNLSLG